MIETKWRAGISAPPRDPQSVEPYEFDWTDKLADDDVVISSSLWAVEDPPDDGPMTIATPAGVTDGQKTRVLPIAGTDGVDYTLKNTIVTNDTPPRTLVRRVIIPVRKT